MKFLGHICSRNFCILGRRSIDMNTKIKGLIQLLVSTAAVFLFSLFIFYPVQAADTIPEYFSLQSIAFAREDNDELFGECKFNIKKSENGLYFFADVQDTIIGYAFVRIEGACSLKDAEITLYSPINYPESVPIKVDEEGNFKITEGYQLIISRGSGCFFFKIKAGNQEETIPVLLDSTSHNIGVANEQNNYTGIYLYDETNHEVLSEQSDFERKGLSSPKTKEYKLEKTTKAVSVEVLRDYEHVETNAHQGGFRWIDLGENYVSINGEPYIQFANSSDTVGRNTSPALYLKKGLNVIQVYVSSGLPSTSNGSGIRRYANTRRDNCVYLIEWDGEEAQPELSANTGIQYIDATQLGSGNVPYSKYTVGTKEDGFPVALPESMPVYNNRAFKQILFGVIPEDPGASWEIVSPALDSSRDGMQLGIYHAVTLEDDVNEIQVKVTAADGKTSQIHSIALKRASSDAVLKNLTFSGIRLLDYDTKETTTWDSNKKYYAFEGTAGTNSVILTPEIAEGASYKINDGNAVNQDTDIIDIEVTAPDTVTKTNYYLFRMNPDKTIAAFTMPESTKQLAKAMLDEGWNTRDAKQKKKDTGGTFWDLYKQVATDPDFDLKSTRIADPVKRNWNQATDYGSAILELIILGENPYAYGPDKHNYVQDLIDCGGGAYANNVWYLMAAKAAGIDEAKIVNMTTTVKNQTMNSSGNLDINGWNLAVTAPDMTPDEIMYVLKYMKKTQNTSGNHTGMFNHPELGTNIATNGCILSGLAGAGLDIEELTSLTTNDGKTVNPLSTIQENFLREGGMFWYGHWDMVSFDKDIIIALGDIVNGGAFYQRYNLTAEKAQALLSQAKALSTVNADDTAKTTLVSAISALESKLGGTKGNILAYGMGQEYYALQDAMYAVDPSLKKGYWICTDGEWDTLNQINETIEKLDPNSKEPDYRNALAISESYKNYQELGGEDTSAKERLQGYVENYATLEAAYNLLNQEGGLDAIEEVVAAIEALEESAKLANKAKIEEIQKAYNALTDSQKTAVTNAGKLNQLLNDLENIETAIKLIEALPAAEQVNLSHEKQIDEAQKAYETLTEALRGEISDANKQKLTSAQARLTDLKAADAVTQKIAAIGTITEANWRVQESAVAVARDSYNRLTAAQKALVTNLSTLAAAESAIASRKTESADKEAAAVIADQIAAIGEITEENWSQKETQVAAIRAAYDRLTAAQKALVSNLSALEAAENAIKEHKANAAADSSVPQIVELIQALRGKPAVSGNEAQDGPLSLTEKNNNTPTWEIWTDEWIQYVADIRGRINRLDSGLVSLITNLPDLEAAEKCISQLQVERAKGKITALPNADSIAEYQEIAEGKTELSIEQLVAVLEAKAAYDHLTPEQKQEIEAAAIANLEALYAKAQTYPDSRILYLRAYLQPYVDFLAYYYGKYQQEGLDRGLSSVQEALGKCDGFTDEERAVLQDMSGWVNGGAVSFPNLFSFLDGQAGQVQKDILDAEEADARIAALPDEITEENVNEVDREIAAIEQMLEQMTWRAKSYMKNQGRLGVLKALVDYYLGGEEVRQAFEAGSPELVSAEALTANQVQVSWMSYDGAASYLLLRKTTNGSWKQLAEVTELAYTDDTAKQGITYHYTVQARSKRWNGEALSSYHTEGLSVTTPMQKLTRPSWKKVQSAGYQSVKLSWYKVSGASGYEVARATSKNGTYRKIATVTKVSCTDKSLTTGKTYYYKVRAYQTGKKKTYGAYSASIAGTPRLAKVILTKAQGVKRAVQLKWKKVNGATGYKVYRATSKNGTFKTIKILKKGTSFKDTGVTPKKTYYYRVCAYRTVKGKTTTGSRSAIGKAAAK